MAEILYTAKAKDQGEALDECVEWAKPRYQLISIIWKEEVDGKHVFTIHYVDAQPAQSSDTKL